MKEKAKKKSRTVSKDFARGRVNYLANCPLLSFKLFIVIIIVTNIDDNDEMILRKIIAGMQRETS